MFIYAYIYNAFHSIFFFFLGGGGRSASCSEAGSTGTIESLLHSAADLTVGWMCGSKRISLVG